MLNSDKGDQMLNVEQKSKLPLELMSGATIDEILYEAEQPVVFTVRMSAGLFLGYLADFDETRLVVLSPTSTEMIASLKSGTLSVLEAIGNSILWLATWSWDNEWTELFSVNISDIPEKHLPKKGTHLYPPAEKPKPAQDRLCLP